MSERSPVYLCFTSWVQMRQFVRDRRLRASDAYLATGDHARWIPAAERPITLVRTEGYFPSLDRDFERWQYHAELARQRNHENEFITEVINV
jgi:hypothetical protein